ncbi:MAG: hypothetical protein K2J71_05810 [Oscillospiraceae bacterium]|nr:hypothetical protein [Oscillospiraceae bacterium]
MVSDSTQKFIRKVIERSKIAEPYPKEILDNAPDEIFTISSNENPLDQRRVTATLAKITLDKYFKQYPEESIDNYMN